MSRRERVVLTDPDGSTTTLELEPRTPLDGHGGRLRQGFTVFNRQGEEVGRVTRYRSESGTVTHWTATTPGFYTTEHVTRNAALAKLTDTTRTVNR